MRKLLTDLAALAMTISITISINILVDWLLHFDINTTWASIVAALICLYMTKDAWQYEK